MGLGVGLFINHASALSLPPTRSKGEITLRVSIGIFGTFFCYFLISKLHLPHFPIFLLLQFFILGLWIATGGILCRKFFLRKINNG
jgi:hypothetical protein